MDSGFRSQRLVFQVLGSEAYGSGNCLSVAQALGGHCNPQLAAAMSCSSRQQQAVLQVIAPEGAVGAGTSAPTVTRVAALGPGVSETLDP
jgi:hypothetical protein